MLRLIRDGRARTHAELVELTGLSRSTVAQRVDALLTQELVVPSEPGASRGGRPPRTFAFNREAGVVLAADLGATHSRVAVTDLAGDVLAPTWHFWDHVEHPLDDVRRALAVPALDPSDAADGVFPDWYQPTA